MESSTTYRGRYGKVSFTQGIMTAIADAVRMVGSSLDYGEVVAAIARVAGEAFDSPECAVWEYASDGDAEILRALYEREPALGLSESIVGRRYHFSRLGDYGPRLKAGEVQQIRCSDPDVHPDVRRTMTEWGEQTLLSIPLLAPGEVLGEMILIETGGERTFTAEEMDLALVLGEVAAVALANARLHAQVMRQAAVRRDVISLSEQVLSSLNEDDVLGRIAASLSDLVGFDAMALGVPTGADSEGAVSIAVGDGAARLLSSHGARDPGPLERCHEMVVPLPGDESAAVLVLRRADASAYTEDDRETVRMFAGLAAVALQNAHLYHRAQERAVRDGLTGLYNHRHFYQCLRAELARATRSGECVSLLMLDIDDFKHLNDAHGHQAGDEVLQAVARAIDSCVRTDVDLAARYGGEEFVVIIPAVGAEGSEPATRPDDASAPPLAALGIAERIRAAVASETRSLRSAAGSYLEATVSVGVSSFPALASTPDELVAAADAALYAAKAAGKDTVVPAVPAG
jgi:diguanylate cyclase (GGDEF)-like protein